MALNSSLQKIISVTQRVNSTLNPNQWLSVRIPGNGLGSIFNKEDDSDTQTLESLMDDLNTMVGDVMTGANMAMCFTEMGANDYKALIGQLGMGLAGAITAVADEIMDAIYAQISCAVRQVTDLFNGLLDVFFSLVSAVALIMENVKKFFQSLTSVASLNISRCIAKENCKDMYAAIGACLLNKFLGSYLEEFKNKAVDRINKEGTTLNNLVYDELTDSRTFVAYANQEAFLLNKAAIQINGLSTSSLSKMTESSNFSIGK